MDMSKIKVGVIGAGFVGTSIARGFMTYCPIMTYDIDPKRSSNTLGEVLRNDVVFVCLPTPMETVEGGDCDLSIIRDLFIMADGVLLEISKKPIFVIKSTVPVGTTRSLSEEFPDLDIVHSPEFLTARCALIDFITPARNIVGGSDEKSVKFISDLYKARFPGCPCYAMSSDESEFIKYTANCFFSTKVVFFNEMKMLSDKIGLNWDNIIDGVMADGRIGKSHYQVPGHDGAPGVGGSCFPKDINAFIHTFEKYGLKPLVLKSVWDQNKELRPRDNWDWANNKSAVSNRNKK